MVTYNDKILVPNATKDGLDTVHPETNTGNVYDFKNNGWLSDTFENVQNELTTHLDESKLHVSNQQIHVTQAKQDLWNQVEKKANFIAIENSSADPDTTIEQFFVSNHVKLGGGNWYVENKWLSNTGSGNSQMQIATSYGNTGSSNFKCRSRYNGNWTPWSPDLQSLFQSVSNGKALVANAITQKGVPTAANAEFATMANNIGLIKTGLKTARGYATVTGTHLNIGGLDFLPGVILVKTASNNQDDASGVSVFAPNGFFSSPYPFSDINVVTSKNNTNVIISSERPTLGHGSFNIRITNTPANNPVFWVAIELEIGK